MKNAIDWHKTSRLSLSFIVSGLLAYYGQPLIHGNDLAINVIVTVYSILAGFLIAILAVVGDPLLLSSGTWRAAEMDRNKIIMRLNRHKVLFETYLVTLLLLFLSLLFKEGELAGIWLERGFLFFGTLSFICSFYLPRILMKAQEERIDAEIKRRRKLQGLN
ncbi:MAG: hypothetical protein AB1650_01660 [Candidatus Omnitrophota bacterium]